MEKNTKLTKGSEGIHTVSCDPGLKNVLGQCRLLKLNTDYKREFN